MCFVPLFFLLTVLSISLAVFFFVFFFLYRTFALSASSSLARFFPLYPNFSHPFFTLVYRVGASLFFFWSLHSPSLPSVSLVATNSIFFLFFFLAFFLLFWFRAASRALFSRLTPGSVPLAQGVSGEYRRGSCILRATLPPPPTLPAVQPSSYMHDRRHCGEPSRSTGSFLLLL